MGRCLVPSERLDPDSPEVVLPVELANVGSFITDLANYATDLEQFVGALLFLFFDSKRQL